MEAIGYHGKIDEKSGRNLPRGGHLVRKGVGVIGREFSALPDSETGHKEEGTQSETNNAYCSNHVIMHVHLSSFDGTQVTILEKKLWNDESGLGRAIVKQKIFWNIASKLHQEPKMYPKVKPIYQNLDRMWNWHGEKGTPNRPLMLHTESIEEPPPGDWDTQSRKET